MSSLADLPGRVAGFLLRLVWLAAAAVFTLSLLVAAFIVMVVVVLRALLTGRRPAPAAVWTRFRDARARAPWPGHGPGFCGAPKPGDVVDVEVREVASAGQNGLERAPHGRSGLPPFAP